MFSSYHSSLSCIISFCILLSSASGAVVNFAADLTWELGAPDGQQRYVIHTNGQFPGPPLVLKQGDSVEVREQRAPASLSSLTCLKFTVISHLPFPTTIHFHGIEYDPETNFSGVVTDAKAVSDRQAHLGRTEFPEFPKNQLRMAGLSLTGGQQPSTEHIGKMQTIWGLWLFI